MAGQRLVEPAAVVEAPAHDRVDGEVERVELGGMLAPGDRLVVSPARHQENRVPRMRQRVVGPEIDRAAERSLGRIPVPVEQEARDVAPAVPFRQIVVELERPPRRRLAARYRLARFPATSELSMAGRQ
jgi:hypothetical protein